MNDILNFLKDLEANNAREWFDLNRDRYDATRKQFLVVAEQLIHDIRQFDDEVPALNPKDCVFRIFRDVRFSKDKLPFKSNYGCFVARGGKKSGFAGYYLHIQPGECFLSGGIYMPLPEYLQAIRQEIYYHPKNYIDLIENKEFKSAFTLEYSNKLRRRQKDIRRIGSSSTLSGTATMPLDTGLKSRSFLLPILLKRPLNYLRSFIR